MRPYSQSCLKKKIFKWNPRSCILLKSIHGKRVKISSRSSSSPFDKLIQFNNPKFGFPNRSLFSLDEFLLKLLKCKTHDAFGKIRLKFNLKILCCQKSIPLSCFATAVKVRMIKSNDKLNNVCVMQAEKRAYKRR